MSGMGIRSTPTVEAQGSIKESAIGIWLIVGIGLCFTGVGLPFGILMILFWIFSLFQRKTFKCREGDCPYCGSRNIVPLSVVGVNCPVCKKRFLLKDNKFEAVPNENAEYSQQDQRRCPFCAEFVKEEAIYCRFCQKDLVPDSTPEARATAFKNRVLCSDDNCIGVIGADGKCKACGKSQMDGACNNGNYSNIINEAKQLIHNKLYTDAINILTKAIIDNYNLADCHYLRAVAYSKIKNTKEAIADLQLSAGHGNKEALLAMEKIRQNNKIKTQS